MTHWKHKTAPLLLPLLLLSNSALALQLLDAKEGETLFAKIAQKEITRISVEAGRIRKVTGNAGEFVLEKDDERGQVFIRPAQTDSTKPINVFLGTERGTVALLLQPVDSPSDTIVIREKRERTQTPATRGRSSAQLRTLKNLLLALAADTLPEDMEVSMEVRTATRELALWPDVPDIRLTLQRSVITSGMVGERFQLANNGSTDLELTERDLHQTGVIAISLEQQRLQTGEFTYLFVIREQRRHD